MKFDEEFLKEVGLSVMTEEEKKAFLDYIQEELEVRIGEDIAAGMTEDAIMTFSNLATKEEARAWLEKNRPDYRTIVQGAIAELKEEIKRNKAEILG